MRIAKLAALAVLTGSPLSGFAQHRGWQPDPQLVQRAAQQRPDILYHEERVPAFALPDLLATGGNPIQSPADWRGRRAEILELFQSNVYGRSPGAPQRVRFTVMQEDPRAMDGAATLKRIAVISSHQGREHRFVLDLFLPNAHRGPVPTFLLLNNRPAEVTDPTRRVRSGFWPAEEMIARGYGIAALQVNEVAPDDRERYRDGAIHLFEGEAIGARPGDAWGALAAWAWGASRAMDFLQTEPRVDATRVAVVGHSRGGKAALWAGAQDERFALVISNNSGEGGAALSRRRFGETVSRITQAFPHWFAGNFAAYSGREDDLPVDQHMLLALIAPRAVYVASADEDLWADPRGEFLSLAAASPVFALWGDPPLASDRMPPLGQPLVAGRRGYHIRAGGHDLTTYDWQRFADFAEAVWRPRPAKR